MFFYATTNPGWTVESASVDLGVRVVDVEAAKQALCELRLLTPIHAGSDELVAAAPDVALASLVDPDERRIQELRASVASRRRALMALLPAYREARESAVATERVEVVEDPETVMSLLMDVGRRVTDEVLIALPGRNTSVERAEESNEKDRQLLEQGIARRTLYQHRRRDHVPTQRTVIELEPLGAQFRTLPVIPFRMLAFDRKMALVARQRDASDRAALVFRDPDVVSTFVVLFDTAWEFALPFHASGAGEEEGDDSSGLSELQRAILAGLHRGLTDEVLASRLGISVRTCRRHIACLFDLLGAESRFQAGVLAAARGWVRLTTDTRPVAQRRT
ncbi:helix-turn-helix transcriptional regulator [Cellulosimicrobium sp. PMB13]|uniref:helix-turn-helix transcriptional regulator n=1 Tax=Cellulosimicrobium sp. PMB13 TaxID=3120158 RepID=UPI003F4C390A